MQKNGEHQQPIYMYFADFRKSFDCVSHERFCLAITDMSYSAHIVNLLSGLFFKQQVRMRVLSGGFYAKKRTEWPCDLTIAIQHHGRDSYEEGLVWKKNYNFSICR